ncbi:MAG TPA: hypothetical protein VK934_00310 [Fimbriimonas sp.]|nr:hypothetical protein [Fimbriimonas sp.]
MIESPFADVDLAGARPFVQSTLPTWLIFEVLDGISDVDSFPIYLSHLKRFVEHASGWADERMARKVFLVSRLLTDQHDACVERPLSEHRLGCVPVKRAARACGCFGTHGGP